jgi:hypothetical protein
LSAASTENPEKANMGCALLAGGNETIAHHAFLAI